MLPSSGCEAIRASSGTRVATSNPGMPSKCQYWATSGISCGTSDGRPARICGLTFIDRDSAAALQRAERDPRTETSHVGIFAHQLLHERIVILDITRRNDQHEITIARDIPGLLDRRFARDPALEHRHQLRPLPLDLDIRYQGERTADALGIDYRDLGGDHRLLAQARDPALNR